MAVKVVPIPDVVEAQDVAAWSKWWPLPTLPATAPTFARCLECHGHKIISGAMLCAYFVLYGIVPSTSEILQVVRQRATSLSVMQVGTRAVRWHSC